MILIRLFCLIFLMLSLPVMAQNPEVPPSKNVKKSKGIESKKIKYQCGKKVSPNIIMDEWFFGIRHKVGDGRYRYTPVDEVPLKTGQDYGFRVWAHSDKKKIYWKYEYELPEPYANWPKVLKGLKVKFSENNKIATFKGVVKNSKLYLEEFWFFLKDDAKGMSRMTLYLDGYRACEFIFEVK
ncbi:hypothetical protein BVY03_03150 [bacterium K02(2017)]|nr:hypothetical protein BVY03_03150 [bacterium K02(2017)]